MKSLNVIGELRVLCAGRPVGMLAMTRDGVLAFEYDEEWLRSGFSISPFSLPLERRVFVADLHPFDGVFGVFDDSLPDEWGRLLVDRLLRTRGIDPFAISPLARLAIVGKSGMGALEYEPEVVPSPALPSIDLDELAAQCANLLATNHTEDLDVLFELGGSSGGARPKVLISVDGADWIVKFPSSQDSADIGLDEFHYSQTARACGIDMPETRLFPSDKCVGHFGVRRFDRVLDASVPDGVRKIHMVSGGGLLETSHRVPNLDYDLLMRLTLKLTDDLGEVMRLYRLMCFNVLAGNKDDHARNFSFLYDEPRGTWTLSPVYDLTRNPGMGGERATMVNGKGRDIGEDDLIAVGTRAGITPAHARMIAAEVAEAVSA